MIALWSSKRKLVPDVKSLYNFFFLLFLISLTHCEWCCSLGLMMGIFKLGFFWSSSGFLPTASFKKLLCLAWMAKTYRRRGVFFVVLFVYLNINFIIMVERLDWGFGFSPCRNVYEDGSYLDQKRSFGSPLTLIQYWQWDNEKAIISPSPTFILRINEWLRSLCSKIIAHGSYRKKKKKIHNNHPLKRWSDLSCWFVFCTVECLCCQSGAKLDKVGVQALRIEPGGRKFG